MRIIGITGGIGSGKSTISRILYDLGARIVDADKIAREVVRKGEKAYEEITAFFGRDILDDGGELDRKKLAALVFDNKEKLEVLTSITHKYIIERMIQSIEKEKDEGKAEIVVIDAPIPVEHGFVDMVDEIWVVTADKDIRIRRIMDRSGYTLEEALKRVEAQKKEEEYLKLADEIICNNGGIEELEKQVARLFVQKVSK